MDPARSVARLLAFTAAILIVLPASGRTIAVSFQVKGETVPAKATMTLSGPAAEPVTVVVTRLDTPQRVTIATGIWNLEVKADGFWHSPQVLTAGPEEAEPLPVRVELHRTGSVAATVTAARMPDVVSARFEGRAADGQPLHGEVNCPVAEGMLTCELPAGMLDLRLHTSGHVTRFALEQRVTPGERTVMRAVNLVPGQMIVGRVQLPRGVRDTAGVAVIIKASDFAPATGAAIFQQRAIVEKNGLFHLDGMTPGTYTVTATAPGSLISDVVEVPVRALTETEMRDPLVLYPALQLAVEVTPARAPDQTPWRIRMTRSDSGRTEEVVASSATPEGRWSTTRLRSGTYELNIEQTNGDVWHHEDVAITDSDVVRRVELTAQPVSGTVKLGDTPLQAKLTFSRDEQRVHTVSDRDGTFSLRLPNREMKGWSVLVENTAPDIHRELDVELRDAGDGRRMVDITLPATVLSGHVVDESGAAAPWALLTIRPRAGGDRRSFQASAAPDGTFELHALEEGEYAIEATLPEAEADPVVAKCCADDGGAIRIVMRRQRKLAGRVVSAFGPVAGARLVITPVSATARSVVYPITTDTDGTFSTTVPAATNELDLYVVANGLAFTMDHMRYHPGRFLVTLESRGGALTLRGKGSPQLAIVVQEGALIDPSLMRLHAGGQWNATPDGWTLLVPMTEPGPYSLCRVAPENRAAFRMSNGVAGGRCVSGQLPPGGALTLELPD